MTMRALPLRPVALAALLGAALTAAPAVWAQGIEPQPFRFGQVGLARLQNARVSVVVHPPDACADPAGSCPPEPGLVCRVALGFVDAAGNPFRNAAGLPIAAQVDLAVGASAWLDLLAADAFRGRTGLRVELRPTASVLEVPPDDGFPPDPCQGAVPTFEVFDAVTGRTQLALYPFGQPPLDDSAPAPTGP